MTTNQTANYIAQRGVTKHMSRSQALAIWRELLDDGWIRDRNSLLKPQDHEQSFMFLKLGQNKVAVSHCEGAPA